MLPPPEPLAQTQQAIHDALWMPQTPPGLDPQVGLDRRFSVYRNNVQHGLSRALAQRFGVVERLVGAVFFAAMARVFAAQSPPRSPVLIGWGGDFPTFLAGFAPVAHLPFLPDVARLDWARGLVGHAADTLPADAAPLGRADVGRLVLRLAPTLALVECQTPAVTIWRAHHGTALPTPLPQGPEYAAILRARGFEVQLHPLDASQYRALSALAQGVPLAQATADSDPTAILALLLRHGLITSYEDLPA